MPHSYANAGALNPFNCDIHTADPAPRSIDSLILRTALFIFFKNDERLSLLTAVNFQNMEGALERECMQTKGTVL